MMTLLLSVLLSVSTPNPAATATTQRCGPPRALATDYRATVRVCEVSK